MPTMYDSVTLTEIPANAEAVAGYVNGRWPTYTQLAAKWPHAHRVSIAVNAEADADCLDIENGDATPAQAPAWVRRQIMRGVKKPVVYANLSTMPAVLSVLKASGIGRSQVRVWTAHYTHVPHRCTSACGKQYGLTTTADATQYTNVALNRNLDASLVTQAFLDPGVTAAARRQLLRAWILAQRAAGLSWTALKKTSQWKLWRNLGGH